MADKLVKDMTEETSLEEADLFYGSTDEGGGTYADKKMQMSTIRKDVAAFSFTASRNSLVTSNIYLRGQDGLPTNEGGFVVPANATIIGIGVTTNSSETWVAEVRKNGSATVIASISVTAAASDSDYTLNVSVNAGDVIQMYCNGTNIDKPSITVYFRKR